MNTAGHPLLQRRQLLLTLAAAGVLAGCAANQPETLVLKTYHETLSSLLLSQDRQHLVVIGEHHHYIFDTPQALVAALESPLHARMEGELGRFSVSADGRTEGDYALLLPTDLDEADRARAAALGFQPDPARPGGWRLAGHVAGQRYLQGTVKANRIRTTLNHPYTVEIQAEQPRSEQVANALVTPVTTAANGVNLLYYVVLAPILVPFALISRERAK
ncbi:hypothetical protein F7Q92_13595 [Ideonella dechloratans]|uniref:5-formyltetrahydrofolate cyclo-ligase n=1 Tax=Ideonella dechloratans TaxID=36863 RepID=A0A643FA67_IDEDE|nr:hypothetical protein [Ideonella dechloratans]KAB0580600.1 hypothetical protein F7Q92_13595 [Ideonella dechloratans]UFU09451.1 hypothetical protein LRM40_14235 [Ideonella dechloratans]